ncbi:hypothetical protein Bhyg_05558 [Pseudolycoriella hygida]|uniref:Uncharacterized protein n=1 Tax=Pseudolycoriella hygida TaxID=35572 RepID=A0A9Q0MYY6_9DIPT|nr:hypothetical protein Bhyg_05558 [Pseudolycoriella hygida]
MTATNANGPLSVLHSFRNIVMLFTLMLDHTHVKYVATAIPRRSISENINIHMAKKHILVTIARKSSKRLKREGGTREPFIRSFKDLSMKDADIFGIIHIMNKGVAIQRLQMNMKIGVFFKQVNSVNDIKQMFDFCKDQRIIDIFAAGSSVLEGSTVEQSLDIFLFHPFEKSDIPQRSKKYLRPIIQISNNISSE